MSKKTPANWSIKNLDSGEVLNPDLPVAEGGVHISIGGVLVEQPRFGMQDPVIQWVRGKAKVYSFTAVFYSRNRTEMIKPIFDKYEKLAIEDAKLGRPPICVFTLGAAISEVVLVESADADIPDTRTDGQPREIRVNFVMKKYVPFSQKQIDPTKTQKESFYLVVSATQQSYEEIARQYYGDPMLGDRLRKRHKDAPMHPEVGDVVKVPARTVVGSEVVRPDFHAFNPDDEAAVKNFDRVAAARAARKVVLV
jgi:hypothetical protein